MNVGCCMGETYVLQTRPEMVEEVTDPSGKVISRTVTPAQTQTVTVPGKAKDKTLPVLAAIAAAYFLLS